jgi:hypothetical protein
MNYYLVGTTQVVLDLAGLVCHFIYHGSSIFEANRGGGNMYELIIIPDCKDPRLLIG